MATTFAFKFVTPTGVLFDGQAEQVNAVNPLGEFGILADHTNYITSLVPGLLTRSGLRRDRRSHTLSRADWSRSRTAR